MRSLRSRYGRGSTFRLSLFMLGGLLGTDNKFVWPSAYHSPQYGSRMCNFWHATHDPSPETRISEINTSSYDDPVSYRA